MQLYWPTPTAGAPACRMTFGMHMFGEHLLTQPPKGNQAAILAESYALDMLCFHTENDNEFG